MIVVNEKILITGCAGFIGGALALRLITSTSAEVIGIDSLNDYYDIRLKEYRLDRIRKQDDSHRFKFIKDDIADKERIFEIFEDFKPDIVIHLAAQAGVRYSIENPDVYMQSNIIGFYNMVEACRFAKEKLEHPVKHFLFASSSSVYGNNEKIPYSENDNTDHPVSLYAATKKADEVIGYSYAKLYGIPMTGMRFFTVYGPAGRPDMAYYKFTEKLIKGEKIELYNQGKNKRDFTYIDDVIDVIEKMIYNVSSQVKSNNWYKIINIGNNHPIDTLEFVRVLADEIKKNSLINEDFEIDEYIVACGSVPGDVETTFADISCLETEFGITPKVSIDDGLRRFIEWYLIYKEGINIEN